MTTSVTIADIVIDAGTQIRAAINEDVVTQYAERMAAGDVFPPVVLFHDGSAYYVGDGFHRTMAAKRNGLSEIPSDVRPGTKQDALWFALGANKENGLQLTKADKKHAILLALQTWPERSMVQMSEQIGCSLSYVKTVKDQVFTSEDLPSRVTGKDGKSYPASRNTGPHPKAEEVKRMVLAGESTAAIASVLAVSNTTVTKTRKELGLGSDIDKSRVAVAQRRKDIRDMAERGFTTRQIAAAVGIHETSVSEIAKVENIVIHADRAVRKTARHDANRIVDQMVTDADNLTADVALIDFSSLDASRLAGWIDSLSKSRHALGTFIRRLTEEQKKHGEAA